VSVLSHFLQWCVGLAPAETQTTEAERAALSRAAKGQKCLAEIGVWHGVTTRCLLAVMDAGGVYYAIDPYPRGRLGISFQKIIAHREIATVKRGKVRWIELTSAEAADLLKHELSGRLDFLFIDGDHSYEGLQRDWMDWSPLVAESGIIALHDSRSTPERPLDHAGSVRFTNEKILSDSAFQKIAEVDSLTIMQRVSSERNLG
jgi:predicted O-methyltransferase YrrM